MKKSFKWAWSVCQSLWILWILVASFIALFMAVCAYSKDHYDQATFWLVVLLLATTTKDKTK